MKDARPSFKKPGQPESSREACRQPSIKEEGSRFPHAPDHHGSVADGAVEAGEEELRNPSSPLTGTRISGKTNSGCSQYHLKPSAFLKSRNSIHEMEVKASLPPQRARFRLLPRARLRVTKTVQPSMASSHSRPGRRAQAGATPPLGRRPAGKPPHFQEAQTVPRGATSAEGFPRRSPQNVRRGIS